MKYSIIIPAYNAEAFIEKCLDSVRKQTFQDFEVIVIDDGSTDNTSSSIASFQKEFPHFPLIYTIQENGGAASARNTGIEKSNGSYIAFLDADDIWYPDKLEKVNAVFETNGNIDVVYHDEIEVDLKGKKTKNIYRTLKSPYLDDLVINGNSLSTSTVVVKRERLVKANTFKDGKRAGEDIECWIKLAEQGCVFYHLNMFLGEYRRTAQSLTLRTIEYTKATCNMHLEYFKRLDPQRYTEAQVNQLINNQKRIKNYMIARNYHFAGNFEEAANCYKDILKEKFTIKPLIGLMLSYCKIIR